jgi:hypothetical protein
MTTLLTIGFTLTGLYLVINGSPFWALLSFLLAISPSFVLIITALLAFIFLVGL